MEIFETVSHPDQKVNVFQVEDSIALISTAIHHEIGTSGIFSIIVIAGSFEILGYKLTPASPRIEACSTKEHSLKITPLPIDKKHNNVLNQSHLHALKIPQNVIQVVLANFSAEDYLLMVTVKESSIHFMKYIDKYIELPIFSSRTLENPIISPVSSDSARYNTINIRQEWNSLGSTLANGSKKVVITGGKGVGKSTLLRYLVNKSLSGGNPALILDFDPGQAECTIMGCISAVLVTQPLLGPNFSHLVSPVKCLYVGCISVYNYSKQYLACIKEIIGLCKSTKSYRDIPWFINTMGFTKGLGVTLLRDIILNIQPTDVIQINSKKKSDNFPDRLTPQFILDGSYSHQISLNYQLHILPSASKNNSTSFDPVTWGLNPAKKRGLVALSYFFDMLQNGSFNFLECLPYKINIKNINILIATNDTPIESGNFHKLSCINGNMVALCYSENNSEFLDYIGLGIVRGVDFETEEIFIITPLNELNLKRVNVVHMNPAIQLPQSVFRNQSSVVQEALPYLAQVFPSRLNQLIKKSTSRIRPYSLGKNV